MASNAGDSPLTVALSGTGTSSTTNLALNRPDDGEQHVLGVTRPSNANDGNTSTYWESTDGAGYPQTLTVNLGSVQSLGLGHPGPAAGDRLVAPGRETLSVLGCTNGTTWTSWSARPATRSTRRPATRSRSACRPAPATSTWS